MDSQTKLKIASWNLCLRLQHKKDYVKRLLNDNNIEILNLQETEIPADISSKVLEIQLIFLALDHDTLPKQETSK